MKDQTYRVYGYRWVVLGVFMFINLTIQMLWITFAPIPGPAAKFYGVSDSQIGLLAMTFMIAYIPLSLPVSWVIDRYGFRLAVSIGAVMTGIFGTALGMLLTPILTEQMSIPSVQLAFGGVSAVAAVLFVILARERPLTPPC